MHNKIIEFLYLGTIMDRLTQVQGANNQALQKDSTNIKAMATAENLKNDHDILLPILNGIHKDILHHYEEKAGKKFKFL